MSTNFTTPAFQKSNWQFAKGKGEEAIGFNLANCPLPVDFYRAAKVKVIAVEKGKRRKILTGRKVFTPGG